MRITPENIEALRPKEVIVFGSNKAAIHGAGAAKFATRFGAHSRCPEGLAGWTYAIPTKGFHIEDISVEEIKPGVDRFINFAIVNPNLTFLVTAIGCGLACHSPEEIAPLFHRAVDIPNIFLPERFWEILNQE